MALIGRIGCTAPDCIRFVTDRIAAGHKNFGSESFRDQMAFGYIDHHLRAHRSVHSNMIRPVLADYSFCTAYVSLFSQCISDLL